MVRSRRDGTFMTVDTDLIEVTDVEVLGHYRLRLTFSDGRVATWMYPTFVTRATCSQTCTTPCTSPECGSIQTSGPSHGLMAWT